MSAPLDSIYAKRFDDAEASQKHGVWRAICAHLQQYVDPQDTVLDVACDRGYFIENISAREKWATDLRDVSSFLSRDVTFVQHDGLTLGDVLAHDSFDVAFMSNYLEHLGSGDEVIAQLRVVRELLRPGGRVLVLQPNVRLVGGAYWDFIDHKVALTERSLIEAAELAGLETEKVVTRFLPFTTKSRLPQSEWLVRGYLRFPPAWRVLGKQTLYLGRRPSS